MKFSKHLLIQMICYYCYATCNGDESDFTTEEDKPYEPIKLMVPQDIWQKAFILPSPEPTPVVRSHIKTPVTIVVPVHVPNDDYDEITTEAVATEETTIQNDTIVETTEVVNDTMLITTTTPVENVTTTTAKPQVEGQLFRFPCSCRNGECGCCTGAILQRFNMKACGNISFIPEDFVFDVKLRINNSTVVHRRVSASDPPPVCFNPGVAPFVEVCAEISNIRIRNRNAYACLDIDANIGGFPIYSASFRCFGLGTKGIQSGLKPKPVKTKGPKPVNLFGGRSNVNNTTSISSTSPNTSIKQDSGIKGIKTSKNPRNFKTIGPKSTVTRNRVTSSSLKTSISPIYTTISKVHQNLSAKGIKSDLKLSSSIGTKELKATSAITSTTPTTSTTPITSTYSSTTNNPSESSTTNLSKCTTTRTGTGSKFHQVVTAKRIHSGLKLMKPLKTKGLKADSLFGGKNSSRIGDRTSTTPNTTDSTISSTSTTNTFSTITTDNRSTTTKHHQDLGTKRTKSKNLKPISKMRTPNLSRKGKSQNGGGIQGAVGSSFVYEGNSEDDNDGFFEETEFFGDLYDGRYL